MRNQVDEYKTYVQQTVSESKLNGIYMKHEMDTLKTQIVRMEALAKKTNSNDVYMP